MPPMEEDVSKNLALVGHLHNLVREHPEFEVLCKPSCDVYCFRYFPNWLTERRQEPEVQELLERLNEEIVKAVQCDGSDLLTMTRVAGRVAIRISMCSHRTLKEDVDATFEATARWGRLLTKKLSVSYDLTPNVEAKLCSSESHSSPTEA
jgi:aromatic-L-amino-acid/L-tryptophan decarboxylase